MSVFGRKITFIKKKMQKDPSSAAYDQLVAVIRRLRRECPWDREQTHASARHLLVEEAYEAVDAIEQKDFGELRGELGDLALQVIFHSVIAEDCGHFTLEEVLHQVKDKLIRRHPHVYGNTSVTGTDEVLRNWEEIKKEERRGGSVLDGVPRHLPALLAAHRMQEKAAGVGFEFEDADATWDKVKEEVLELSKASDSTQAEDEFGDVLFALVNYARHVGINAENALRATNKKFQRRFAYIESQLAGKDLRSVGLEEMDRHWEAAKDLT